MPSPASLRCVHLSCVPDPKDQLWIWYTKHHCVFSLSQFFSPCLFLCLSLWFCLPPSPYCILPSPKLNLCRSFAFPIINLFVTATCWLACNWDCNTYNSHKSWACPGLQVTCAGELRRKDHWGLPAPAELGNNKKNELWGYAREVTCSDWDLRLRCVADY